MEHSVLCGSRKYRAKEPFIELEKSSLNTYLNASTFPDKTAYPVASPNLKDFYNLIDVYLDAVFYPLIPELTLKQEGWHYELSRRTRRSPFKGVVFNEMKGNYSSPDDLLGEHSQHAIFPDILYGLDSGGDPLVIPNLTYEDFKNFHASYYHPSNSYIWFYGDDPEDERLRLMDAWLEAFDRQEPRSAIRTAKPLLARRPARWYQYDSGESEDPKSYITLNWMLDENEDAETSLGLSILAHILTGTPAAPLRKVLMESGWAKTWQARTCGSSLRQMTYSTGMKGVQAADLEKVEALNLEDPRGIALHIDADTIAASVKTVEFYLREMNTGRFPLAWCSCSARSPTGSTTAIRCKG